MNHFFFPSSNLPSIRSTLKSLLPFYQLKKQILQILIKVWERYPQEFDETLLKKAELLFVFTSDEFKEQHTQKYLIKLIFSFFLIKKSLRKFVTIYGEKRHLQLRLMRTTLKFPFGSKSVLGLLVGICLFDKQEIFEEKHLLLAVQKFVPLLQIVKGSVILYHDPEDSIRLVYVEFEKKMGGSFSCKEIAALKKGLHIELQARVEKNIPPLLMIRNEEEVMKNILILSRELDFSHEIPEMIINFEQQLAEALSFTVILVRVLKEDVKPAEDFFPKFPSEVHFSIDRRQIIGYLEDIYPKEAIVFRLEIPIEESFLRADFSINFYLAREKVKSIVKQVIGPARDFNGGMILKQGELLSQLKEAFQEISEKDPLSIENFFYSLTPIEKQATLPLSVLCRFFQLFLDATHDSLSEVFPFDFKFCEEKKNVYAILKSDDPLLFKTLKKTISSFNLIEGLVSFKLNLKNFDIIGFHLNKTKNKEQADTFFQKIDEAINLWKKEIKNRQIAHFAIRLIPTSFDPRIAGDENTRVLLKMLFEGLMRIGPDGKPIHALAETVTFLPDKLTYIFHLRPSFWSDGSPLVAYDFEYAWKKILSPDFHTPYVYLFYPIKNARLVKEGSLSLDEVGVKAIDEKTLQVVLEHPVPYFLELISHSLFSPISHQNDRIHPNWSFQEGESYLCNGPFRLKRQNLNYGYEFVKNTYYWDVDHVALDQIFIHKVKDASVYDMFEKGTIDWIGRLFPYWDPTHAKRFSKQLTSLPSPKISWCIFNTRNFFLQNQKIRKALSYCIDKAKLVFILEYEDAIPTNSLLPLYHSKQYHYDPNWFDANFAKKLFHEGLTEIGLQQNDFPTLSLLFPPVSIHEKTAQFIKQQWKEILGINCQLVFYEWPELFPKICQGDYQIALITWTSLFDDPIYTLNAFKNTHEEINFSQWENPEYQHLLDLASEQNEPLKRNALLNQAEKILMEEMPVNPLFLEKSQFISQNYFHVPCDAVYGYPDFKWASIKRDQEDFH